jgi:hypothetical protein
MINIMDSRLDPEESLKRIDQKIAELQESGTNSSIKMRKYNRAKAKLINHRLTCQMQDHAWAEILAVFVIRTSEINPKERKFESKATKLLSTFLLKLPTRLTRSELKRKEKAPRAFPWSKKDDEYA